MIWENENSGVTVQVLEKEGRRELRFGNHIMQSVFSTVNPDHLVLPYTRFMLLGLLFCPEPKSVLHIGLGGGSIVRWMYREFPTIQQTIIEINPAVIEAARRFFEFPLDKRLSVMQADATQIITKLKLKYDIIFQFKFCNNLCCVRLHHTQPLVKWKLKKAPCRLDYCRIYFNDGLLNCREFTIHPSYNAAASKTDMQN